jgi:hypothetical protein
VKIVKNERDPPLFTGMFVISRFHYSTKFNFLQLAMFVFEIGDCFQGSDTWPGDITGQFFISVMDFLPPDTYPWPGDITGQCFILCVLDFLPQTPTPSLGISLVSSLFLSWIFSPRPLPMAWRYHWSVLYICP